MLDSVLDDLIIDLTPLDHNGVDDIVCGNIDFREKIQILKGLAFVRSASEDWRRIMVEILDLIDNDLRNQRNTIIHSRWIHPVGKRSPIARTKKTKLRGRNRFSSS
jgi:hypothetical protein